MKGHEIVLSPGFVENQNWSLRIFFADSEEFILSCEMQATWNKSLKASIVYCVQYLEKIGLSFKICFNDMMWYQTWSLHYRQTFAWYLWSLSWCLMQLLATSTVVQFLTNQLKLSKPITPVIICTLISDTWRITQIFHLNFLWQYNLLRWKL